MPRTAPAKPFVLVDYDKLSNIQTALGHAFYSEDEAFRRSAEKLVKKLNTYEDRVYKQSPQETEIALTAGEYETLLNALEFFVATDKSFSPIHHKAIGDLWSYMILEGGHLSHDELLKLRKRYDLE